MALAADSVPTSGARVVATPPGDRLRAEMCRLVRSKDLLATKGLCILSAATMSPRTRGTAVAVSATMGTLGVGECGGCGREGG